MKYIKTNWNIPYYNMALEEYLMQEMPKDDYVFFYIHSPSIIIGKHQNTIEEINQEYVNENNIFISRRLSGGGAVYHDEGNLNFSFVMKAENKDINNFKKFTQPIILALKELGIESELSGRNDLTIDGKKFSGNAQYARKGRLLHHGTLLFDSTMSNLSKSLNVKELKIKSKGVKSVKSRVTNIKPYLKEDYSIFDFKNYLINYISELNQVEEYHLTEKDHEILQEKVNQKFSTWDWNWGESPRYDIQKVDKFECGIIDVRLEVNEGKIDNCVIFGDFFVKREIGILEDRLTGVTYRKEDIRQALQNIDLEDFFKGMSLDRFVQFLLH